MKVKNGLEKFLIQLDADGRSPHTIAQYARHVRLFSHWSRDVGHSRVLIEITHEDIARFFTSPQARTRPDGGVKKASSANALRSSMKGFFQYLHRAGYIVQDFLNWSNRDERDYNDLKNKCKNRVALQIE